MHGWNLPAKHGVAIEVARQPPIAKHPIISPKTPRQRWMEHSTHATLRRTFHCVPGLLQGDLPTIGQSDVVHCPHTSYVSVVKQVRAKDTCTVAQSATPKQSSSDSSAVSHCREARLGPRVGSSVQVASANICRPVPASQQGPLVLAAATKCPL